MEQGGLILVDKPAGETSRRVAEGVGRLLGDFRPRRRRGGPRFRVGHAGTLDPLATGLLLVPVGRATRLQSFLQGLDKRYLATVRLGTSTDTLDRDGEIADTAPVPALPDNLDRILAPFTGTIMQEPPVYSAIKRGGESLHRLVRRDADTAPPPPRPVTITSLQALDVRWGTPAPDDEAGYLAPDGLVYEIDLDIACGSGTYIRSLARDLALALGTVGHIQALRRLEVGPFDVAEATSPEALKAADDPGLLVKSLADTLPHLPTVILDAEQASRLCQGQQPDPSLFPSPVPPLYRILDSADQLVAVGQADPSTGQPRAVAVFPPPPRASVEDDSCA